MNITDESISSPHAELAESGGCGYLELTNATTRGFIRAAEGLTRIVSETASQTPVGVPLSIEASELRLVGLGTVATPSGTLEPTWVKVTINGVHGVIPFYPL